MHFDFITNYGGFTLTASSPKWYGIHATDYENPYRAQFFLTIEHFLATEFQVVLDSVDDVDDLTTYQLLNMFLSVSTSVESYCVANFPTECKAEWYFAYSFIYCVMAMPDSLITNDLLDKLGLYDTYFHFTSSDSLHLEDVTLG